MTGALAVYGAVVGTLAAIASATSIYKNRAIVTLKISQLMPTNSFPHWCLALTARNQGWRPVTLDGGGLEFDDRYILVMPLDRHASFFPAELGEGKSLMIWFTVDELKDAIRESGHGAVKYGFFSTATGRTYRKRLNQTSPILKHVMTEASNAGNREEPPQ